MLARLAASLEAPLERLRARVDDQHGHVGLRGARDHVWNEVPVPWRVEQSASHARRGVEVRHRHVGGHAAPALALRGVHDPGERARALPRLGRLVPQLVDVARAHGARLREQVPHQRALSGVHVTEHNDGRFDSRARRSVRGRLGGAPVGGRRRVLAHVGRGGRRGHALRLLSLPLKTRTLTTS